MLSCFLTIPVTETAVRWASDIEENNYHMIVSEVLDFDLNIFYCLSNTHMNNT